MCTNYTPSARAQLQAMPLGVAQLPPKGWPPEAFPGYDAPLVLAQADKAGHLAVRCVLARFGLMPRWSKDAAQAKDLSRHTNNARSETVAEKPSFRAPWRERHFALAPMQDFFEPCWEDAAAHGGKSVRWRIAQEDGKPFAAAGLWEGWRDPVSGELVTSFSLLTCNADDHPLMRRMHRPGEEKRRLVIISPTDYEAWLHATTEQAQTLLRKPPTTLLRGEPAPRASAPRRAAPPPTQTPQAGLWDDDANVQGP
jgi:putative SOS response-associated peptidase YedK